MFFSSKQEKALYYSADPELTISKLRVGDLDRSIQTDDIAKAIDTYDISSFVVDEPGYHFKFFKVPTKPYIVYAMGDTSLLDRPLLGVVGPRKSSPYAGRVMENLFTHTQGYDLVTISGGAPGIDTQCHTLSMQNNIPTIVVLGGGILDYLQGTKRELLLDIVAAGGLILSEFKLWQDPTPWTFPQRNRIIAGLADMLFVPAAGEKSGSLITVDFALGIRTPVYTVPGSIYEATSAGSNTYLAAGKVRAVQDFQDMLDNYFHAYTGDVGGSGNTNIPLDLTDQQQSIVKYLQTHDSMSGEMLQQETGLSCTTVLVELTHLEMLGLVRTDQPGKRRYV